MATPWKADGRMDGGYALAGIAGAVARGRLRFIDLFAGLGGFHQAIASLGHVCVFACEADPVLADLYEKNFGLRPSGDIRGIMAQTHQAMESSS